MKKWKDNIIAQLKAGLFIKTYKYRCCGVTFSDREEFQKHLFHAHHDDYIIHFAGKFHKTKKSQKKESVKNIVLCSDYTPPVKTEIKKNITIKGKYREEQESSKEERIKRIREKQEAKARAIIERSEALKEKKVIPSNYEEPKFVKRTRKTKKKSKRKSNSARLIYTPMGNKR